MQQTGALATEQYTRTQTTQRETLSAAQAHHCKYGGAADLHQPVGQVHAEVGNVP